MAEWVSAVRGPDGTWPERPRTLPGQAVLWIGEGPPPARPAEGDVWHVGVPLPIITVPTRPGQDRGWVRGCLDCGPPLRPVTRTSESGLSWSGEEPDGAVGTVWRCRVCQRLWRVRRAPWAPSGDPQRVWRPLGWFGRLVHGRCVPVRCLDGTPLG